MWRNIKALAFSICTVTVAAFFFLYLTGYIIPLTIQCLRQIGALMGLIQIGAWDEHFY
jgi:hypothetical protein